MSDSVRPHRQQPTRLPRPWDSPGKNIGVGCHFLLQCMKVKSESEVAQSCSILGDPMDCSLRGSSVHGIVQARVLEWVAIAFSKEDITVCLIWQCIRGQDECKYNMVSMTEKIMVICCFFGLSVFFFKLFILYWGVADQQCCDSFR